VNRQPTFPDVDFLCVVQANVSEIQLDDALGLEGGCGNGWLAVHGSMLTKNNDFSDADTMNVGAIDDEAFHSPEL
jgi:hypothetical protein